MASVRKRPTGTGDPHWAAIGRDRGKQTSKTFATEKAAERFVNLVNGSDWQKALATLPTLTEDSQTVGQVVDAHVDALSGVTEGTRSDYRSYRRDLGKLADVPIEGLTRAAVAKWVNDLSGRLSGKSIKNRHSLLSAALTRAQRDGIISDNPAKGVRLPRSIKRDMTILTENEFPTFLDGFDAFWQPLVVLLVSTGARWGEATAFWGSDFDLDADRPVVRVNRAWKHTDGKGRELGPPKTRKGRRSVNLPPQTVAAVRPLVEKAGASEFVFVNRYGRPITQSTFLVHVWQPAVRAFAGDEKVDGKWKPGPGKRPRVHDLRHTYASWQIARGVPLTFIQDQLGHESIQTTSDTYGHLMPNAGQVAAAAMTLALAQAFPVIESIGQELVQEPNNVGLNQPLTQD